MFVHYMYVDILFSLQRKPFQLCLNMLPRITKLQKHGQVIIQHATMTSTRYRTRYHTFSFRLTWTGHNAKLTGHNALPLLERVTICVTIYFLSVQHGSGYLQRVTTRYHQFHKKIYMFVKQTMVTGFSYKGTSWQPYQCLSRTTATKKIKTNLQAFTRNFSWISLIYVIYITSTDHVQIDYVLLEV